MTQPDGSELTICIGKPNQTGFIADLNVMLRHTAPTVGNAVPCYRKVPKMPAYFRQIFVVRPVAEAAASPEFRPSSKKRGRVMAGHGASDVSSPHQ
jgi:hypothetical protein